jgi:hypothetical protein
MQNHQQHHLNHHDSDELTTPIPVATTPETYVEMSTVVVDIDAAGSSVQWTKYYRVGHGGAEMEEL